LSKRSPKLDTRRLAPFWVFSGCFIAYVCIEKTYRHLLIDGLNWCCLPNAIGQGWNAFLYSVAFSLPFASFFFL
jgi:hypothetical protein